MPTIRSYFYRSLKLALKICLAILACILIFFVAGWILPTSIANGVLIIVLAKFELILIAGAIIVGCFLLLQLSKMARSGESISQELLKISPTIIVWLLVVFISAVYIPKLFDDTDCKNYNYNDKLNGGIKEFDGKKYSINICGSGVSSNGFFGSSYDSVLLSITDHEGHLVAKRHYKVFWDGQPGHEPLVISSNSITYQDDESQKDHVISMPPTFFERMMAYIR